MVYNTSLDTVQPLGFVREVFGDGENPTITLTYNQWLDLVERVKKSGEGIEIPQAMTEEEFEKAWAEA